MIAVIYLRFKKKKSTFTKPSLSYEKGYQKAILWEGEPFALYLQSLPVSLEQTLKTKPHVNLFWSSSESTKAHRGRRASLVSNAAVERSLLADTCLAQEGMTWEQKKVLPGLFSCHRLLRAATELHKLENYISNHQINWTSADNSLKNLLT